MSSYYLLYDTHSVSYCNYNVEQNRYNCAIIKHTT